MDDIGAEAELFATIAFATHRLTELVADLRALDPEAPGGPGEFFAVLDLLDRDQVVLLLWTALFMLERGGQFPRVPGSPPTA